jgi:NTP pyrophosphatase (non-canonical NTP hydrolase)
MNWESYLIESKRTLINKGLADNIVHGAIGIATEIGELKEAFDSVNRKEELGDIFWYVAIFWRELELPWNSPWILEKDLNLEINSYTESLNSLDYYSKHLLDQAKRVKFYSMDISKFKIELLYEISKVIAKIIDRSEFDFENILEINIAKLRQRFPEKFTSEKALNRDLNKEREILSGE